MLEKPKKHCEMGLYTHTIPMNVSGRVCWVDFCIADLVAALNAGSVETTASCCGHGKQDGSILLKDGRELIIKFP